MVLTHRERKIICDGCNDDLTDYSEDTAEFLRKSHSIIRVKGKDYCTSCDPRNL